MDYKSINPEIGDFEEFDKLLGLLHKDDIHTCVDFVINHTAKEHEWAKKALSGDATYMNYYLMHTTKETPDAYDVTVPEVFPGVAPGNFTYYDEIGRYVMTSFYEFQWDLNYKNPKVFEGIIDILLFLANKGVDMIRLDAIPFIWKKLGTTCRNLDEIHPILRMMHLIVDLVCPSVALLGEAIVEATEIVGYFGEEELECDVMYNAPPLMVNLWNSLATRDTRLMTEDTNRLKVLEGGAWINYVRCHDDIGWGGFNEAMTKNLGFDPYLHKQFLIDFYLGTYKDTFSVGGELYEYDEKTGDARNCGTMASLCGLEKGLAASDHYQIELAIKRIQLLNAVIMSSTGIPPLIYSGDEMAMLNNHDYKRDEKKAHDSRWLHRMKFDWQAYEDLDKKVDKETYIELSCKSQVYTGMKKLIATRKGLSILRSEIKQFAVPLDNKHVYCIYKIDKNDLFVGFFNFSEDRQIVKTSVLASHLGHSDMKDLLQGKRVNLDGESVLLGPYEYLWLVKDTVEK